MWCSFIKFTEFQVSNIGTRTLLDHDNSANVTLTADQRRSRLRMNVSGYSPWWCCSRWGGSGRAWWPSCPRAWTRTRWRPREPCWRSRRSRGGSPRSPCRSSLWCESASRSPCPPALEREGGIEGGWLENWWKRYSTQYKGNFVTEIFGNKLTIIDKPEHSPRGKRVDGFDGAVVVMLSRRSRLWILFYWSQEAGFSIQSFKR